jgi:hypothetical protein
MVKTLKIRDAASSSDDAPGLRTVCQGDVGI